MSQGKPFKIICKVWDLGNDLKRMPAGQLSVKKHIWLSNFNSFMPEIVII